MQQRETILVKSDRAWHANLSNFITEEDSQ